MSQEFFYPPMECILDQQNCTCPEGRMGLNCELIGKILLTNKIDYPN